ncbi:hypothetical protein MML48_10g00000203 [Holotrichia oblita]|uniref:Uncharacterized protein n=1 Tax=Holotrichia oblita TaxID=644536 RepID=A0ACB9SGK3_HOLOL|nr:hypothetical protein MML48_10g00000203 [Holotrichia oblita]
MLTNEKITHVGELLEILEPMESTTVVKSSERQVTLTSVIIITNGLRDLYQHLLEHDTFSELTRNVLQKILNDIATRFKNMETSCKHILGFSTETYAERAKTLVTNALTSTLEETTQPALINIPFTSKPDNQQLQQTEIKEKFFGTHLIKKPQLLILLEPRDHALYLKYNGI